MLEQNNSLETDSNGDILTKPVTGWITAGLAGTAVLLAIRYVETPEELERLDSKSIQLVLTVPQCLELGERLTTLGKQLFEDQSHLAKPLN